MADVLTELDRRHTLVMRANRVKQSASFALKRLEQQSSPPQWLVHTLRGILELADPLPAELMRWRDAARPADARPAQETVPAPEASFVETFKRSPRRIPIPTCTVCGEPGCPDHM